MSDVCVYDVDGMRINMCADCAEVMIQSGADLRYIARSDVSCDVHQDESGMHFVNGAHHDLIPAEPAMW
jgi:hypothetical protein